MLLDKALKKQKRYIKLFFTTMIVLGVALPSFCYLTYTNSILMMFFLGMIEFLIIIAMLSKLNFYKLNFSCVNNKIKIQSGIFSKMSIIFCNKVVIVHTNKYDEDIEVIIVTTSNLKNKALKPITRNFIYRFPEAAQEFLKLKKLNPEEAYYFQVIRRGALGKYILLEAIYKSCVNAIYTSSAIENIKIARLQNELY